MRPPSPRSAPAPPRDAPVSEADPVSSEVPCDPALEARLAAVRCPSVRAALRSTPRATFSSVRAAAVTVATFNVGAAPPPPGADLAPWLAPRPVSGGAEDGGADADTCGTNDDDTLAPLAPLPSIVAVALQEIVALSPASVMAGGASAGAAGAAIITTWDAAIGDALAAVVADAAADGREDDVEAATYTRVPAASTTLVGLHLALWARTDTLSSITCVEATTVAAGGALGGRLGNKGAAAVRCLLADTPLTFIGAHLPSGGAAGDAGRRDAAVKDALIRGLFGDGKTAVAPAWAGRARLSAAVADADVSFFFGDLNYRLLARDDAARRALAAGDGDKLVLLDELAGGAAAARQCPLALRPHGGWREGRLSFAPTYKKVPRTGGGLYVGDDADADASADATASRTPAWTDRVLWREKGALDGGGAAAAAAAGGHTTPPSPSPPPRRASLLWYDAAPGVDVSDHTPVAACFEIAVRSIDAAALTTAADAARRAADAAEQASTPRVALTPKNIDFGTLERGEVARGALVVTNTGGVPAAWCFSPLDGSLFADGGPPTPRPCPVWADLHPGDGLLAPGESACVQVVVTAGAGPRGAANVVAARGGGLDAVLVLRADGGNDEFVAVGGRVRPSCLGLAPSTLATLDRPLVPDDSWGAELPPAPGTLPSPVRTVSGLGDAAAAAAVVAAAAAAPRPPPASLPPVRTASGVVADAAAAPSPAPPSSTAAPPSAASSGGEFYSPASSLASGASTPGPQSASGLPSPFGGGGSDAAKPPSPRPSRFAPPGTVDGAQAEPAPAVVEPQPPADPPSSAPTTPRTTHLHGLDAPAPGDEAVPPELRALTSFLLFAAGASTTPALLAHAADRARRAASAAGGGGWVDVGVDSLLKALDRGRALDEACTHPADAAAALLTLLACLPSPLIPAAAAAPTARGIVPPPAALGDVLLASLPVAEWATLKHVARVLKVIASGGDAAAAPADATTAVATLATSIADFLLGEPPAPTRVSAAGGGVGADAVAGLQAAAAAADAVDAARAALAARVIEFAPIW